MSANRKSIYDMLGMKASDNFLTVLHRYIDKINPNSGIHWSTRPTTEDVILHFCLVNTEEKHQEYYKHWQSGKLAEYLNDNPPPKTWAMGTGQILSWVKAKALEQELMRAAGVSCVPDEPCESSRITLC